MNPTHHLHQALLTMADGYRCGQHVALGTQLPDLLTQIVEKTVFEAETPSTQVHGLIAQCLQAVERGDWLGLADLLEFEIAPLPLEKAACMD